MENTDFDNSLVFSTSRSFKEWLQDPSNPIVYCLLTLDGKEFLARNSYSVELHQKTVDHDHFIITVPDDALDSFEGYVMEKSKNLLGKNVGIAYWRFGKIRQSFSGIITGIKNIKDEGGGYGNLIITGSSPGILLENGKDCQSFEDKTLEEIIMQVAEDYPQEVKIKVDLPKKGKRISDKIIKDKKGKIISRIVRYAERGESYYAGDGLNKAHITPEQIKNVLIKSKDEKK